MFFVYASGYLPALLTLLPVLLVPRFGVVTYMTTEISQIKSRA